MSRNRHTVIVYTDGACSRNGYVDAQAGIGIWWGHNHPDNVSQRLRQGPQTNNRAEFTAVVVALRQALRRRYMHVIVRTDSLLLLKSLHWMENKWKHNGWLTTKRTPVENRDRLERIDYLRDQLDSQGVMVTFEYVPGHSGDPGNHEADRLARAGASRYR